ncbi:MAG: MATE family efflux transporter [Alphaproteobacteria bacterium]|nr:MAG: MATE family efflux transporter [Alphaproteobacteria bacterium]
MTNTTDTHNPGWIRERMKRQFSELVRLSFPIVFQRLGIMTMGIVDTVMVGRYSTQELAYQSIGYVPVATVIIISIGLMMGTMVLTSNAYGAKDYKLCGRIWRRSLPYGFVLGMGGFGICIFGEPILLLLGQEADIARGGGVLMQAVAIGIPMTTVMLACTFFLEGINRPLPGMVFMLIANLVNVFMNWILVYGHIGFAPMGAEGSAWATTIVRTFLAVGMILFILKMKGHEIFGIWERVDLRLHKWRRLRHIGYGAGLTNGAEHMGFAALEVFAGWIGPLTLGAMAIAFNVYGIPYMIAYGVAGATAVRVGIALGRRDSRDLLLAGTCGMMFNVILMLPLLGVLIIFPVEIAGFFTTESALVMVTVPLIILSAWMLLFDSLQTVIGNALRGRRDVWAPTALYFFSYIIVMIPLSYILAFNLGRGAVGLFESSVVASIISFVLLTLRFYYLSYVDFKRP